MKRHEQIVVLKITTPSYVVPAFWDWNTLCDMDDPEAIQVIASGELIPINTQQDEEDEE